MNAWREGKQVKKETAPQNIAHNQWETVQKKGLMKKILAEEEQLGVGDYEQQENAKGIRFCKIVLDCITDLFFLAAKHGAWRGSW